MRRSSPSTARARVTRVVRGALGSSSFGAVERRRACGSTPCPRRDPGTRAAACDVEDDGEHHREDDRQGEPLHGGQVRASCSGLTLNRTRLHHSASNTTPGRMSHHAPFFVTPGCNGVRVRRVTGPMAYAHARTRSDPTKRPGAGVGISGAVTPPSNAGGGTTSHNDVHPDRVPLGGNTRWILLVPA